MEIYKIALKSARNPNNFVVTTSEGEKFLHSDVIVKFGVVVGEFDDDKFCLAERESQNIFAWNDCLKYVSSKIKTQKQIKDWLYKKGYITPVINETLKKLADYGVVDDSVFVKSYVSSNPNFSKKKLKQKLFSAGVKQDSFEDILDEKDDGEGCLVNAKKYLKNKVINKETIEKLTRRLIGQGYTWDTIKSVINELRLEYEED